MATVDDSAPGRPAGLGFDGGVSAIERLTALGAVERLSDHDPSLFSDVPAEQELIEDRLGWVSLAEDVDEVVDQLRELHDLARDRDIRTVVLVGMGGSSLAPLVMGEIVDGGEAELIVADTTCPEDIADILDRIDFAHTLIVLSSKSGTTVEVGVLGSIFFEHAVAALGPEEAAARFVAISDPDTPLAERARHENWWQVIEARSSVGGRFSALSMFGLVPAALSGIDWERIVERAARMEHLCRYEETFANPAAQLAAFIADGYRDGRDKLVLIFSDRYRPFGLWLEQLIAESLGKNGAGIVPVVTTRERYGEEIADDHTVFVLRDEDDEDLKGYRQLLEQTGPVARFTVDDPHDIGTEFIRWEFAVALLGVLFGVNPFDQPDVEVAKRATRAALEGDLPTSDTLPLSALAQSVHPGDYVALLSYQPLRGPLGAQARAEVEHLATLIERSLKVICTVQIGPRYLHSTGQLHKGGPSSGVFVVIGFGASGVSEAATAAGSVGPDLTIPGTNHSLRALFNAQRFGDISSLSAIGRRVFAADSTAEVVAALEQRG